MQKYSRESLVGVFVLLGLVAVTYMTLTLGKMEFLAGGYYPVHARFTSVQGLRAGAEVEMAGVSVGTVSKISLDQDMGVAVVTLSIRDTIELSDDVIASIKTSGLIGDKYIKLSPGGSPDILVAGDLITETESAVDLEELISKYVFGGV